MNIQIFDYTLNLLIAILWQYNNATSLQLLLTQKQAWYDANQTVFWSEWYTNVFNLDTANDFGLAVWSEILNTPLQIAEPPDDGKPIFGFGSEPPVYPEVNGNVNFNNGNFASDGVVGFTTDEKRFLLKMRYFQLTSRCAIPEVNTFLAYAVLPFTSVDNLGTAYLLDGLDMTITLVFTFTPTSQLLWIIENYDLIPRASGVKLKIILGAQPLFGFGSEPPIYPEINHNNNFDHANFLAESGE